MKFDKFITVRMSEKDFHRLAEIAEQKDTSVSKLVRESLVNNHLIGGNKYV